MPSIDWNLFTPWQALLGGALIGFSALWLMFAAGRIAGISGIVGGLLKPMEGDVAWRACFVLGLLLAPSLYTALGGTLSMSSPRSPALLVVAGLLVGYGTRLGSGCTSGHGVCGLSRLSPRSLAAVAVFMAVGFAVATLIGAHLEGSV